MQKIFRRRRRGCSRNGRIRSMNGGATRVGPTGPAGDRPTKRTKVVRSTIDIEHECLILIDHLEKERMFLLVLGLLCLVTEMYLSKKEHQFLMEGQ